MNTGHHTTETPIPPQSPYYSEAEVSVLGAALRDKEAARQVCGYLSPGDFYMAAHQEVFLAIQALDAEGFTPDLVTVGHWLTRNGKLEGAGGAAGLVALVDAVPTAANARQHAGLVRQFAQVRSLGDIGRELIEYSQDPGNNLYGFADRARAKLADIRPPREKAGPLLTCLTDVKSEAVSWLWPGRVPLGKLTQLVGDPGGGKTSLLFELCAHVTTGRPWSDGSPAPSGPVLILTAEDGLADTVKPRIQAMGGDAARVMVLTGVGDPARPTGFNLAAHLSVLEDAILQTHAVLVGIDPLSAYLGGNGVNSWQDTSVRAVLSPLAALGERTRAAIVGIMHLNKAEQQRAIYRAQGSIAFTAAARAVFAVTEDPEDAERRLLLPVKLNVGRNPPGLAFRLVSTDVATDSGDMTKIGQVVWDNAPVTMDVRTALGASEGPERSSRVDQAMEFLRDLLRTGPMEATVVEQKARASGVAIRTLDRAKKELGIQSTRQGAEGAWYWSLCLQAGHGRQIASSVQDGNLGILGNLGGLGSDQVGLRVN